MLKCLWPLAGNFHSQARTIASTIPREYLGAACLGWGCCYCCHCDVQIDQNKLHKIFHLRSHSGTEAPKIIVSI